MLNFFRYALFFFLPLAIFSKPKIYDCFPFFNELEILEIRLHEMSDFVDYFVLVECRETFRGKPKALLYQRHRDRFKKYNHKIIHVAVDGHFETDNPWDREKFQKNQIMRALKKCEDDDIILIGDVDEIIRGSDMKRFTAPIRKGKEKAVAATQKFYRWFLNRRDKEDPFWSGTIATTYGYLKKKSHYELRDQRGILPTIHNAGWHFSSMGGMALYIPKLNGFSHSEEDTAENKNPKNIRTHIDELDLQPIDETFPRYIQKFQSELIQMGFIDFPGNLIYH